MRDLAIIAVKIDQRFIIEDLGGDDLSDQDGVVAAVVGIYHLALERDKRTFDHG